jgi:hypothetical protein
LRVNLRIQIWGGKDKWKKGDFGDAKLGISRSDRREKPIDYKQIILPPTCGTGYYRSAGAGWLPGNAYPAGAAGHVPV